MDFVNVKLNLIMLCNWCDIVNGYNQQHFMLHIMICNKQLSHNFVINENKSQNLKPKTKILPVLIERNLLTE